MQRIRALATTGVLTAGLLLACSNSPSDDGPESEPPSPTRSGPTFEMPLAVVAHHRRGALDLSVTLARRLRDRTVRSWSALGRPAGPLRTVGDVAAVATDPDAVAVVPADEVTPRVRAATVGGISPLRGDPDYPLTTRGPTRPGTPVVTTVVGDVMLARRVGTYLRDRPGAVFAPLADRLSAADITVGNLESTLSTDGEPTQGSDSFGADPSVRQGLRAAGFDVLSLGNNHLGDYGERAMRQTFRRLRDGGFRFVGAGRDRRAARRPVVVERAGVRVGFLATDSIGETPAAGPDSPGTNRIDAPPRTPPFDTEALRRVAGDVRRLSERADIVIVLPHGGTQYTNEPEPGQRRIARALVRAGADLVAGGHPHWVQGWETVDDGTVVHSLGNFVFDMDFMRETQEGLVLEVVSRGDRIVALDTVPYVIGSDDFTPRRTRDADRIRAIYGLVRSASEPPFDELRP